MAERERPLRDETMKRFLTTTLLAAAVMLTLGVACQARADGCDGGYACGWGLHRYFVSPYYPSDRRIPYFAEHPPVYYSYPVPRTYGYSPYASPPTYAAPEVRFDPIIIPNPYVPAEPAATEQVKPADRSAADHRGPQPLVIVNPYVPQEASVVSLH